MRVNIKFHKYVIIFDINIILKIEKKAHSLGTIYINPKVNLGDEDEVRSYLQQDLISHLRETLEANVSI